MKTDEIRPQLTCPDLETTGPPPTFLCCGVDVQYRHLLKIVDCIHACTWGKIVGEDRKVASVVTLSSTV